MSLTVAEKYNLRIFLVTIYGPQANYWPLNDEMFNLTYKLLSESKKCSDVMDLVPRPMPIGANPAKWLAKEVRSMILRKIKERKGHYAICVKSTSLRMKTEFNLKAAGL
jgi:hypothetical protein